jgi:hypothetical protein
MSASTKGGTGQGALLVISSTPASLSAPASAPAQPPTKFTVAPASSPTGIAILQIKDFTMPDMKWSYDDITNTSSPTIGVGVLKESLATVVDPGEFSATGVFLPSDPGLNALQTAFNTGIANQFQIQLQPLGGQSANGNVFAFNAYVQSYPIPSGIDVTKAVSVKISLKLDSIITVAAGA